MNSRACLMKRLPIVRHVRFLWLAWQFDRWWRGVGCHLGAFPNQADFDFLDDVWHGRA